MGNYNTKTDKSQKLEKSSDSSNDEAIKKFIKKILSDKNANLTFVPDSMEAKLYEKLINVLLVNIKESLSTVKIELIGHVITLNINPIENESENNNQ